MLAGPEAAIKMTTTRRAARRMPLGSSRLPNGPLRGSRPPGAFGGDCLGKGIPGGDDGCSGSPGDGPPGCDCRTAAASTSEVLRSGHPDFLSSSNSAGLLSSDHIERSPGTLRCGPIRVAPFSCTYAMLPGSCTTCLDHEGP